MARGWESKDVESQMDAREELKVAAAARKRSEEEARREQERESVKLQRARILDDMKSSVNPRYREVLERSLRFLDEKLAGLQ
jgi:hypothetical protein